ncbi:MAG TPA: hypothetical protein PJ997_00970 [Candidatus Paceibacterota bacterium]|nr:hypothetical protein [Candidatus Paceibacterota bacterium]
MKKWYFLVLGLLFCSILLGCKDEKNYYTVVQETPPAKPASKPKPKPATPSTQDRDHHVANNHVEAPWGDATTQIHGGIRMFRYEPGSPEQKAGKVGFRSITHSDQKGVTIIHYMNDGSYTEKVLRL